MKTRLAFGGNLGRRAVLIWKNRDRQATIITRGYQSDAGLAIGMGIPIIVMHDPELTHALKEIDAAAVAVTQNTQQIIEILKYISQQ